VSDTALDIADLERRDIADERRDIADERRDIADERRTTPVELLWDLVFVFAITQVTTLLWRDLTWGGFGRAMLVLALVWWAWSAFVWAANAHTAASGKLRACLLISAISIFISGLSVPHAFGSEGTLFAVTYAIVRVLHLALYADASRQGNAEWSAIAGFALTVAIGMALLIAGSFASGTLRIVLWALAAAIDYAGPAWLTRQRLRGLQHVAVAHFAEHYSLFVIICLGESIVAIGVGALGQSAERPLSGEQVVAVALGLLITIAMWWTYFEGFAETAAERLRRHRDPVLAAADAYSYLHLRRRGAVPGRHGCVLAAIARRGTVRTAGRGGRPVGALRDRRRTARLGRGGCRGGAAGRSLPRRGGGRRAGYQESGRGSIKHRR
jgi:low temperature requirement protein LtrA